jgi:hypothetical protein
MTETDVYDINKVRSSFIRIKFSNELSYLQDTTERALQWKEGNSEEEEDSVQEQQENWMSERIVKLTKIIELIDAHSKIANKPTGKIEHDEINKYVFQKSWIRLPAYHKSIKLTEYLTNSLKDKISEKELNNLIVKGTELINSKQLTNKLLTYDSTKGQITELAALIYTKKKDKWSFVLTQQEIKSSSKPKSKSNSKSKSKTKIKK